MGGLALGRLEGGVSRCSTVGGHLVEGCIINTTCELVIGVLDGWEIATEFDAETGYDELIFKELTT